MRISFSEVFQDNGNGSYTPKHKVKIGGITMGPGGVNLKPGVSFCGVDVANYVGHDLEVDRHAGGTIEIKRII